MASAMIEVLTLPLSAERYTLISCLSAEISILQAFNAYRDTKLYEWVSDPNVYEVDRRVRNRVYPSCATSIGATFILLNSHIVD
jgi:hypothetical protein